MEPAWPVAIDAWQLSGQKEGRLSALEHHCPHQLFNTQDAHHALEVIGKHMKAHLCAHTRASVLVKKWVQPIQCLIVPNGCSTVWRRTRIISG